MTDISPLPTTERLLELIDAMRDQPILMAVDLVADRFISGSPKRISREAPVLILRFEEETFAPGGGANAAANVAALGGEPLLLGVVGDDDHGHRLLDELAGREIATSGVLRRAAFRTPTKTRILGGGRHSIKQQMVRYDIEQALDLSEVEQQRFGAQLERWQGRAKVAVLSDYGYGAVLPSLVSALREALRPEGTVLCDSRYRLAEFAGIDGATPNEEEVEVLLGRPLGDSAGQLLRTGFLLLERLGASFLLITRGSYGMSLLEAGGCCQIPVHGTDQVADVTGAGDTVIGTFALALAAGATALEAALLSNYAGGIVVMKRGTATLSPDELRSAVKGDPRPLQELRWETS